MDQTQQSIVVLTGAGISAESGIPTFRGPDGLWEGHDPHQLATPRAFRRNAELVWRFYSWRRELVASRSPNAAHKLLAEIESLPTQVVIITQNVDGYHQKAGSKNVLELHGSLWRLKCSRCPASWDDFQVPFPNLPPTCPECGEMARPGVVWFGESLDQSVLEEAISLAKNAAIFLSIGTSSVVFPAADLPVVAHQQGAYMVEINPESTPISHIMDETLRGPASSELASWWEKQYPKLNLLDTQ